MHSFLLRADQLELNVCLKINWLSRFATARFVFRAVSRLGDGVFWYSILVMLTITGGVKGAMAMLHTGLTALAGVYLYSFLKRRLLRPRPYVSHGQIVCQIAPLDQYSFPSGHTLHAVLFAVMLSTYAPALMIIVAPFAVLVAISRVVLGVHYPSDVVAGAVLGLILSGASLTMVSLPPPQFATDPASMLSLWLN
ncbi:MAG: phosphatase PAP2 family protein [Pseudomonadota bacterium]